MRASLWFLALTSVPALGAPKHATDTKKGEAAPSSAAYQLWEKRFNVVREHCDPVRIKAASCAYEIQKRVPGKNFVVGTLIANLYMPLSSRELDADAKRVRERVREFAREGRRVFKAGDAPCQSLCWATCVSAGLLAYDHSMSKITAKSPDSLNRLMQNEQRDWSDLMSSPDAQDADGRGYAICRNFAHFGADFLNMAFGGDAGGWMQGKARAALIAGEGNHSYVAATFGLDRNYFVEPQLDGFEDGRKCLPVAYRLQSEESARLEKGRAAVAEASSGAETNE